LLALERDSAPFMPKSVVVVKAEIVVRMANGVAEQGVIPYQIAIVGARVGIEQQRLFGLKRWPAFGS
jgi:hypothetical protein